jgi:hypothetical protein
MVRVHSGLPFLPPLSHIFAPCTRNRSYAEKLILIVADGTATCLALDSWASRSPAEWNSWGTTSSRIGQKLSARMGLAGCSAHGIQAIADRKLDNRVNELFNEAQILLVPYRCFEGLF